MTRTLGDFRITVSTSRAPPVWHPFLMLARLEIWDGHIYSTKWCVSAEEVQQFAGDNQSLWYCVRQRAGPLVKECRRCGHG